MTTKIKSGVIAAGAVDASALSDNSITIAHLNCSDGTNGQVLTTDGSGTLSFSTISGYTDSDVETYLNASEIYTDATNNRLGIGTNSPDAVLTTVNSGALTLDSNDSDHSGFGLLIEPSTITANTVNSAIGFARSGGRKYAAIGMQTYADVDQNGLNFYVQTTASGSSASLTEAMRIDSAGNVGIGTNNPSSFFADSYLVVGDGTGTPTSTIYGSSSGSSYLLFADGTTGAAAYAGGIEYNHSSDFLAFFANGGSAMRIDSAGNLLIGTDTYSTGAFGSAFGINISATRPQVVLKNETYSTDAFFGLADNLWVGTQDAINLILATNDAERLRIESGGLVTAGTSTSSRGYNIRNWSASGYIELSGDLPGYATGQYPVLRSSSGYLYISVGNSYSSYISSNGVYTVQSDVSLKTNINTLSSGQLNKITNLRGVSYNWIDENKGTETQIGLIAQEVEAEYPELVSEGAGDLKGVNYAGLVSPLIEAIKELKLELDAAKARIETLEG